MLASEAANGPDAVARERASGIPVLLQDIAIPLRDGLDVLKQLKQEFRKVPVLMLSTYPDRPYAIRSLKLGAAGYLNKSADTEQMIEAVHRVARCGLFIAPSVAEQLASAVVATGTGGEPDKPLHECLSQRGHQVFRLLSHGQSVSSIEKQLALSSNTVSTYRARVLEKTGLRNDVKLAL